MEQPAAQQQPVQQYAKVSKGGKGWMVAAIILGLGFLGTGGYIVYNLLNDCGIATDSTNKAKCAEVAENVENKENSAENEAIAVSQSGDYVINLYRSGFKLNLGSEYEFINIDYSSSSTSSTSFVERVSIGGLTKNTKGYQNIPDFARGLSMFIGGGVEDIKNYWEPLAFIDVYEKSYYEASIQPTINEATQNEVAVDVYSYGTIVYSDDNYVALYRHPQNVLSPAGWEQDWETETTSALQTAIKDSANWSK